MTQEPECVIEEWRLREILLKLAKRESEVLHHLAATTRHKCEAWLAEGLGCANCNATAGAIREYWDDPIRKERDELSLQVKSLTARLAAQSGYAEDEELAALREDKARLDWLEQNVYSLMASEYSPRFVIWNRPNADAAIDENIRALIDTVREMGANHHDPRKGAE